jgi:ABC-type multidrug transport system fused ATPase/permease subunit
VAISTNNFERLFSLASWHKTKAWLVIVGGVLSNLLLIGQLVCLLFLVGLFETRGVLEISPQLVEAIKVSNPKVDFSKLGLAVSKPDKDVSLEIATGKFEDRGIIPLGVYLHEQYMGKLILRMCEYVPALRTNNESLLVLLLSLAIIGLLRTFITVRSRLTAQHIALDQVNQIRKVLHRQALRLGPSDLKDQAKGDVFQVFTTDMDLVRTRLAEWIFRVSHHPITLLLLFVVTLVINWRLSLQCIFPLGVCWYIIQSEYKRWYQSRLLTESRSASQTRLLAESLNKTRLVRAFGMEHFEQEQFQKHLVRFQETALRVARGELFTHWSCYTIVLVCVTLVLYLLGIRVLLPIDHHQHLTIAAALLFVLSFVGMRNPLEELSGVNELKMQVALGVDKAYRYLDQIPEVGQAVGAKFIDPLNKQLHFEAVSYHIPNQPVRMILDRMELKIPAKSVTAIISTDPLETRAIAFMLPRFIEPQHGRILYDGEDIAWGTLESLRAETVFIGEEDRFFTGTVMQNITCGNPEYTVNKAMDAAKMVHAHHFITRLPQGYETMLGEHGEQLDAGQGFRLTLARAALRNPAILIIEEPSVNLDESTKDHIDDAYTRLFPGRTVILLPYRLSTLKKADKVVLLNKGRVEAAGTHQELVGQSALYRHWEYTQFNTFRHSISGGDTESA